MLEAELDVKQAELDEALHAPWPDWAKQVLKMTRDLSGYDGYDDQDGIDVAEEVAEAYAELTSQIERLRAMQPAQPQAVQAGAVACFWRWRTRYAHTASNSWSEWHLADVDYGRFKASLVNEQEYEVRWLYEGDVRSVSPNGGGSAAPAGAEKP